MKIVKSYKKSKKRFICFTHFVWCILLFDNTNAIDDVLSNIRRFKNPFLRWLYELQRSFGSALRTFPPPLDQAQALKFSSEWPDSGHEEHHSCKRERESPPLVKDICKRKKGKALNGLFLFKLKKNKINQPCQNNPIDRKWH